MFWKFINYVQQSMLLPARLRTRILMWVGVDIHSSAIVCSNVFIGSNKIHLSADSFVNIFCFLDGNDHIHIGQCVRLGPYVKILTGSHTINPSVYRRAGISSDVHMPVTIERGSWLGMGVMVMPGVTIAEGCVIGSGAVVTSSTEPNGLYVGIPAKRIKDLPLQ